MTRARLPAMQALQAFDAVARYGGVSKAAQALHRTHGAISHAIKGLEDWLGVPLFTREGRGIRLTEAGQQFAARVGDCLRGLEVAITSASRERSNSLIVVADASFASCWLLPRLGRYLAANPGHDLHLKASPNPECHLDEADVALCYLKGTPRQAESELLVEDELFPVCSARADLRRPRQPPELARFNLIRMSSECWMPWFRAAGLGWPEPTTGPMFDEPAHALQAAAAGSGVALARRSLMPDDALGGELLRPFCISAPAENDLYMLRSPMRAECRRVRVFHDWMREELRYPPRALQARAA